MSEEIPIVVTEKISDIYNKICKQSESCCDILNEDHSHETKVMLRAKKKAYQDILIYMWEKYAYLLNDSCVAPTNHSTPKNICLKKIDNQKKSFIKRLRGSVTKVDA